MEESMEENKPKKHRSKKLPIIVGVVAVIVIVAGVGLFVWHEQPGFCNAICHTPMDPYLETYEQEAGQVGVDKFGNEVENTSALLCVSHKASAQEGGADATCLTCHVPTLSEQVTEGVNWVTGNYYDPLEERDLADLTEARGISSEEFCLNESCHNMTVDDLKQATSHYAYNPHSSQHGKDDCSDCHKAHRASVMKCAECHSAAAIPEGWITPAEDKIILKNAA